MSRLPARPGTAGSSGGPAATVGYLTKRFPRLSETFILDEILGLEAAGVPLRLYAVANPGELTVQPDVARVKSPVTYLCDSSTTRRWRTTARTAAWTVRAHVRLLTGAPCRYLQVVAYLARRRRHFSSFRNFAQAGRLAVQLRADGVRHLHAAFAHGPASVAHFVHLLTGMPFSFAAHAKDIYVSAPDLMARKVRDARFVLTCSESAAHELEALAGADASKILLAHHGVDTERFSPPRQATGPGADDVLRVLAVGRLVPKKGYPLLLEALSVLVQTGVAVACTIVGEGDERARLEALADALGVRGVVELVGARTHQQIADSYQRADVFVQTSVVLDNGDRDGIPNSLLEAMATGLPVVATNVGGIPEVVVPGCGLLVEPGDVSALVLAFARLAQDADLRLELGRAARVHVAGNFDRNACVLSIAPLFWADARPAPRALAGTVGA